MSLDIDWSLLTSPSSSSLSTALIESLNAALQSASRPSFIGPITVTSFSFGSAPPEVEIKDIRDPWRVFDEEDSDGDGDGDFDDGGEGDDPDADADADGDGRGFGFDGDDDGGADGYGYGYGYGYGHGQGHGYAHAYGGYPEGPGVYRNGTGTGPGTGEGEGEGDEAAEVSPLDDEVYGLISPWATYDADDALDEAGSVYSGIGSGRGSVAAVGLGAGLGRSSRMGFMSPSLMSSAHRFSQPQPQPQPPPPPQPQPSAPRLFPPGEDAHSIAGPSHLPPHHPASHRPLHPPYPTYSTVQSQSQSQSQTQTQSHSRSQSLSQSQPHPRQRQRQRQQPHQPQRRRAGQPPSTSRPRQPSHLRPPSSPPPSPPARPRGLPNKPPSSIPSLQLHLRLSHTSDLTLTLLTSLQVNYPSQLFMSLPLKLSITGLQLAADLVLAYSGDKHRVHVCVVDEDDHVANTSTSTSNSINTSTSTSNSNSNSNSNSTAGAGAHGTAPYGGRLAGTGTASRLPAASTPIGMRLLPHLQIESEIGHADAHVLRNVGKVERFIADVVRKTLVDELVFPNFHTIAL